MKPVRRLLLVGLLLSCAVSAAQSEKPGSGSAVGAAEPRERAWLVRYVTQPIPDTPRNRVYLKKIDGASMLGLLDRQWLASGTDSGKGRLYATLLGQMAFAYHTTGTRWHKDKRLLEEVRAGLRGFAKHRTDEGRFVWPQQQRYEYQAHEHVWRLEPLLLAYIWVQSELPDEERRAHLAMLKKAGEYLLQHPLTEANNRGAVWCAGTALCGLYFDDARYLKLAREHASKIMAGLLNKTGEVVETQGGGGPDSNYSYVGIPYAYLYRLLAGADDLDEPLLRSTRWLVYYASLTGSVLAPGASTRMVHGHGDPESQLPSLERYAASDPYLAWVADQYVATMADAGYGRSGLTVHPLIWALLEKRGAEPSSKPPPWYRGHTEVYDWPKVHYLLASRTSYQAGVVFRSTFPLRGMQTFAWGQEPPIVQAGGPRLGLQSATEADGLNLSREDVAKGPNGWEVWVQKGEPQPGWDDVGPVTVTTRQGTIWTVYAFTPSSLVVAYGGAKTKMRSVWVMNGVAKPMLDDKQRAVSAAGRKGQIAYLRGQGAVKQVGETPYLEVVAEGSISAFGFSDASLRFGDYDAGGAVLSYEDASGKYQLSLWAVLDAKGNIDRRAQLRLAVLPR